MDGGAQGLGGAHSPSMSTSFFSFVLVGLCVSFLCEWSTWKSEGEERSKTCSLAIKDLVRVRLRKIRLWGRVGTPFRSRGKGKPAWLIIGLLLLSGDVELNPGPRTGAAGCKLNKKLISS